MTCLSSWDISTRDRLAQKALMHRSLVFPAPLDLHVQKSELVSLRMNEHLESGRQTCEATMEESWQAIHQMIGASWVTPGETSRRPSWAQLKLPTREPWITHQVLIFGYTAMDNWYNNGNLNVRKITDDASTEEIINRNITTLPPFTQKSQWCHRAATNILFEYMDLFFHKAEWK